MNVLVDTEDGMACICGDVIYDVVNQLINPFHQTLYMEPAVTGNHAGAKRREKAAIRKAVNSGRFLLPMHDRPAVIEHGRVVGRLYDSIPGPVVENEAFPGPLTEAFEAAHPVGV